jgi:hypothetical protein
MLHFLAAVVVVVALEQEVEPLEVLQFKPPNQTELMVAMDHLHLKVLVV